jgi:hypothetical protein
MSAGWVQATVASAHSVVCLAAILFFIRYGVHRHNNMAKSKTGPTSRAGLIIYPLLILTELCESLAAWFAYFCTNPQAQDDLARFACALIVAGYIFIFQFLLIGYYVGPDNPRKASCIQMTAGIIVITFSSTIISLGLDKTDNSRTYINFILIPLYSVVAVAFAWLGLKLNNVFNCMKADEGILKDRVTYLRILNVTLCFVLTFRAVFFIAAQCISSFNVALDSEPCPWELNAADVALVSYEVFGKLIPNMIILIIWTLLGRQPISDCSGYEPMAPQPGEAQGERSSRLSDSFSASHSEYLLGAGQTASSLPRQGNIVPRLISDSIPIRQESIQSIDGYTSEYVGTLSYEESFKFISPNSRD